ncbi:MAG: hypothetical protein RL199_1591 [Pseudomonadota bacterium]|jgi:hypothetical protein
MNARQSFAVALAVSVPLLWGCPDDPTQSHDLGWIKSDPAGNAHLESVDASKEKEWTYLSFAKGVVPAPENPDASLDWDVAFQRYNVKTNGGTSGSGQGAASDLGTLELQTTTTANVARWTSDAVIADARTDEKRTMNAVLSGWYAYHFFKHELVSKYHLYAVRAADGRTALFKIHDYYDDAGTPAKVTVIYRFPVETSETGGNGTDVGGGETVAVPDDVVTTKDGVVSGETNFDARDGKTWGLFTEAGLTRLASNHGTGWDLSFKTWLLQTNSGTSGTAQGGALAAGTTEFASATTAPDGGWLVDDVETIGAEQRQESTNAALAGWFDYDPTNQKIRSQNQVVWIRTHDGRFAKLQIAGYYHPDGSPAFYRLRWAYRAYGGRVFP